MDATMLRALLGERIPTGGSDTDTFFTTAEIDSLLGLTGSQHLPAAVGWSMKMADLARLIDINESGSDRKLRQRFLNARQMVDYYRNMAKVDDAAFASAARVVGKPIAWAKVEWFEPIIYPETIEIDGNT